MYISLHNRLKCESKIKKENKTRTKKKSYLHRAPTAILAFVLRALLLSTSLLADRAQRVSA